MLEHLARLGYVSKAVVYAIVGVMALFTATNRGGRVTDADGALRLVLTQPFGRALLIVLATGLCGYAVWRLLDAVADPDHQGTTARGIAARAGNAIRGCVYGALGVEAVRLLRGTSGSNGNDTEMWTARILELPFGEAVLAIAGATVVWYGLTEVVLSVQGRHQSKLDLSPLQPTIRPLIRRISRFGVGVRGGLLATLGVFLVRAALTHDPDQAVDSRESMLQLGALFEGRWFLAFIAAGVIAYSIDQAVHARCRRIEPVL